MSSVRTSAYDKHKSAVNNNRTAMFYFGFGAMLVFGWTVFPYLIYRSVDQPIQFSHKTHTGTILSFGTPILDGWGTQGQFSTIVKSRGEGLNDRLKIIQVESAHSGTAQLADEWFAVRPGTEAALALSLANILISEKFCDISRLRAHSVDFENPAGRSFTDLTKKFTPDYAAERFRA